MDEPRDQGNGKFEELRIRIPVRLVKRIEAHENKSGMDTASIVIEALDDFLRKHS